MKFLDDDSVHMLEVGSEASGESRLFDLGPFFPYQDTDVEQFLVCELQ
jgi:hypothetical protein